MSVFFGGQFVEGWDLGSENDCEKLFVDEV